MLVLVVALMSWLPVGTFPFPSAVMLATVKLCPRVPALVTKRAYWPLRLAFVIARVVTFNAVLAVTFGVLVELEHVIVVAPALTPVASPVLPPMLAAAVSEEAQLDVVVTSCELLSLKVPVAVNC